MWISNFINHKIRGVPLWIICVCGLAGILVDIDHPITYLVGSRNTQALHLPLAIVCCLVLCGVGAYCGGLYLRLVLTRKRGSPPVNKP